MDKLQQLFFVALLLLVSVSNAVEFHLVEETESSSLSLDRNGKVNPDEDALGPYEVREEPQTLLHWIGKRWRRQTDKQTINLSFLKKPTEAICEKYNAIPRGCGSVGCNYDLKSLKCVVPDSDKLKT